MEVKMKNRSVAIDGPSGAGKSSISRAAAKKLGFIYIDTGALYRVIGLRFLERGGMELETLDLSLKFVDGEQRVFDGERDVTEDIRRHEVSKAASDCSALPEVRAFLLGLQRDLAKRNDVIMDGRDIGTVVLPDADLKIFLTAAPEDRAQRRYEELFNKGSVLTYEQILQDIKTRDYNDSNRKEAPLRPAEDAVLLDTTGNTFEKSAALIEGLIRERFHVL
jgi:cytidylate kinase